MATTLYLRDSGAGEDYGTGNNDARLDGTAIGWQNRALSTSPGAGLVSNNVSTVTGPTNGIEIQNTTPFVWYSAPLDADVTISGSITWNIWAAESNMSANVAINGILEVVDGATGAITLIDKTARTTEVAVTTRAVNNFAETPASGVACKRGDRLRVRIFADDAGTMASGFSANIGYNGGTGGADGDTFLTLTETLSFASEPGGSQVFLTEVTSDVATAAVDREAWTSRGSGVINDVVNTTAGWTAPIQLTDTAGGTVSDWWTRQLAAFTLGGAVRCNIRALESSVAANATVKVEVAVTDSDGTNPVVWATGMWPVEFTASEAAYSFLISGADVSVSAGQRLRIRVYIDDSQASAMASGHTATVHFAGTSGGASGDTFLTFTQTLTESVAGKAPPFRSRRRCTHCR